MRLVCLYDFSSTADLALESAAFLVHAGKHELVLYHVCEEEELNEKKSALKQRADGLKPGVHATYYLDTGDFLEAFAEYLRRWPPDMLVFCTRGLHGWKQHLLGAQSVHLCEMCPAPALVLNHRALQKSSGEIICNVNYDGNITAIEPLLRDVLIPAGFYRCVVHAVDDGGEGLSNLRQAEEILKQMPLEVAVHLEPKTVSSLGLAGDIIRFAARRPADLLLCRIKQGQLPTRHSDWERLLNNEEGLPVLVF